MNPNYNVYIYPNNYHRNGKIENSYLEDLSKALENEGCSIIKGKTGWLGPLNFFKYIRSADLFFVNWLEEVEITKLGFLKVPLVIIFLFLLRFTKIKLVWTIHNKRSHDRKRLYALSLLRRLLFKKSDIIIAHAHSDLDVFGENKSLITYYPHPFKPSTNISSSNDINKFEFVYDIIIWGRIEKYKGILEFLEYLEEKSLLSKYKILIHGKCSSDVYWKQLEVFQSESIEIKNNFIDEKELLVQYSQSKIILFTYKDDFLLSSGALIHSLNCYKTIFGPDSGNFKDFSKEGIVITYSNFDDLNSKLDFYLNSNELISQIKIKNLIDKYIWEKYTFFLMTKINESYNK